MSRFSWRIRPPGRSDVDHPPSTPSTDGLHPPTRHESDTTGPKHPRYTPRTQTGIARAGKPRRTARLGQWSFLESSAWCHWPLWDGWS